MILERRLFLLLRAAAAIAAAALCTAGLIALPAAAPRQGSVRLDAPAGAGLHPTTRSFQHTRSWSEYVTMRDGVRLAVDVHLPKGLAEGERTATILHMSRYYRSVDIRGAWRLFVGSGLYPITERDLREAFVKAGYSWVDVDVRGAGASFGYREYPLSSDEVRDGADLMDWIGAQPWSSAIVGATGASYDGALASLLVRNRHPALRAIAPRFSGWDVYGDIFLPGGLQATSLLHDWTRLTSAFDQGRLGDVFGWTGGLVARGVRPVVHRLLPEAMAERDRNVDLESLIGDVVYRDDTFQPGGPATMDQFSPHALGSEASGVPIYAYAGWYDGALARGQIRQYLANGHPGSRLRLGPWFHAGEFNASPHANGRNSRFDHAGELIRFFDYHLRGIDAGFSRDAPVHYYAMGDEQWRSSQVWPPPGAEWKALFLAPERGLRQQVTNSDERAASNGQRAGSHDVHAIDTYRVDGQAASGSGSRWGLIVGTGGRRGYGDRRAVDRRLLTYTTPPLDADLEVTGHPTVRLFLSANADDAALFAYLEDVHPSGEVRYISEGLVRLLHRRLGVSPIAGDPVPFRSYRRADGRPLVPDEVVEVVFDLLPTSFVFRSGHAIRLAIAGADAGTFATPVPASPLVYELHRDSVHPSRLDLPTYRRPH